MFPRFIKTTLVDKEVYKEKFLGSHGKSNGVISLKQVPFFEHQQKIVLANCGVVNPVSIDAYLAHADLKLLISSTIDEA